MERTLSVFVLLVVIWLMIQLYSVKVYRFYRPSCPHCVSSQAEWDLFVTHCRTKLVKCCDINLDDDTEENKKLAENFGVRTVPTVVAVKPNGSRYTYGGDRTAGAYSRWLETL